MSNDSQEISAMQRAIPATALIAVGLLGVSGCGLALHQQPEGAAPQPKPGTCEVTLQQTNNGAELANSISNSVRAGTAPGSSIAAIRAVHGSDFGLTNESSASAADELLVSHGFKDLSSSLSRQEKLCLPVGTVVIESAKQGHFKVAVSLGALVPFAKKGRSVFANANGIEDAAKVVNEGRLAYVLSDVSDEYGVPTARPTTTTTPETTVPSPTLVPAPATTTPPVVRLSEHQQWLNATSQALSGAEEYLRHASAGMTPDHKTQTGQRLAITDDIDDTALQTTFDWGSATPATLAVAKYAHSRGIEVLFNTARIYRSSTDYERVKSQLELAGYPVDGICMRRPGMAVVQSKQLCRQFLRNNGAVELIANIANKPTDFVKANANDNYGRAFRLPSTMPNGLVLQ